MEAFKTVIWIINIFSSLAIIALVLMQHGKGADAGASFGGSGSAQGVFGSSGNANFLTRMTAISAVVFFCSCLALGYVNSKSGKNTGLDFTGIQQSQTQPSESVAPVVPKLDATPVQSASAEVKSASEVKTDGLAAAAIAGTGAAVGKVLADKVNDKKDVKDVAKSSSKNTAKTATSDKKKGSDSKKSSSTEKSKTVSQKAEKKQ